MSDPFTVLPADLFVYIIFPQLNIEKLLLLKFLSKRCKDVVEQYQPICVDKINPKYMYIAQVNQYLPQSHCVVYLDPRHPLNTIQSYRVIKSLHLSCFPRWKHSKYNRNYPPTYLSNFAGYALSMLNWYVLYPLDLSNLTQLEELHLIADADKGYDNLSDITKLSNLKILYTDDSYNPFIYKGRTELIRLGMHKLNGIHHCIGCRDIYGR